MTSSEGPGQIITFYSYKGGTGRSMALANVACLFAQQADGSRPVLAIDWDLEAPGLHLFFRDLLAKGTKHPKKVESILNEGVGLIELLVEIRQRVEAPGTSSVENGHQQTEEEAAALLRSVAFDRFVLSTSIPRLQLLKAGRFDADYPRRVNTFNWEAFYNRSPWLFQSFAEFLTERYEYVLIDSRTGRTDTSNICTMLMPQKLVVVFTPNRQSLTGVEELVRQATAYRRKYDIRRLLVYPLPSRIENSEPQRKEQWRFGDDSNNIIGYQSTFEKIFKEAYAPPECRLAEYFDAVQVQHVPSYAYGEELATLSERATDISSLHFRFKNLCDWMVAGAPPWEAPKVASAKEKELAQALEEAKKKSEARQRKLRKTAVGVALILLLISVGAAGFWYSAWGQIAIAKRQLKGYLNGNINADTRWGIVRELSESKALLGDARQAADSIADPDAKAGALKAVAAAWAQAGDTKQAAALFEQARQVANSITDGDAKARALQALAVAWAQAGDTKQAASLLEQARQVANTITVPEDKASALGDLAAAWAQAQAEALQAVAGRLAALGNIRGARKAALEQPDDGQKALTLATVLQRASADSVEAANKKDAKGR